MKRSYSLTLTLVLCLGIFCHVNGQQTFNSTSKSVIGYLEYIPADYYTNSNKYPVVIFLHGISERGVNSTDPAVIQKYIAPITNLGPPQHVKNGHKFPFILISPQLKNNYGTWPSSYIDEVIEHVKTYLRIDESRIYVTGLSLGGGGAWVYAEDYADKVAAVGPVCGGYNTPSKACNLTNSKVPVWTFHGSLDGIVNIAVPTNMVNAMNRCSPAPSPAPKFTIYPDLAHNVWYRAYATNNSVHTPNLYEWMLSYTNTMNGSNYIPRANAGSDITLTAPASSVTITGSGTDNGGSIDSYTWIQIQGPKQATLANANTSRLSVSGLVPGTYTFRLKVADNQGATDSDYVTVTISSSTANVAPVANAGADKVIQLPTNSVILNGSAADPDGSVTSYAWTKVSGGAATLTNANTKDVTLSALVAGTYVFRLTVRDDAGASSSDDVTVTVNAAANTAPTANAGADKTITLPTNSVSLGGSATDRDGTITNYTWTKVSGGAATLTNATTATLTASGLVAGTYVFRLTVKDNGGATGYDDVSVVVKASASNVLPIANAGPDRTITLPTNSIVLDGKGTDSDGWITTYAWSKVSGGAATFANAYAEDLTITGLQAGTYVFRLTVKDNIAATVSDDVTVVVNPSAAPPVANAGPDKTLTLPTNSVVLNGSATSSSGIASYAWTKVSGGAATLTNAGTKDLTVSGLVVGVYVFRLTVIDNAGATASAEVTVTERSSSAPIANAGSDKTITLPTNSVVLNGTAVDDGQIIVYNWTQISGPACTTTNVWAKDLTVTNLTAGTVVFRFTVRDDTDLIASDEVVINVNPNAAPAPPTANAGPDRSLVLPLSSVTLTGSPGENDANVRSVAWTLVSGPWVSLSGVNTNTLVLSNPNSGVRVFKYTVTNNDGSSASDEVTVTIAAATNQFPIANAGADRTITVPVSSVTLSGWASDPDGSISSYEWSQLSGPACTMSNTNTKDLLITNPPSGVCVFRLVARDNLGWSGWSNVTVTFTGTAAKSAGTAARIMAAPVNGGMTEEIAETNIEFNMNKACDCEVAVYDGNGKKIYNGPWKEDTYAQVFNSPGLYIYRTSIDNYKMTKKYYLSANR